MPASKWYQRDGVHIALPRDIQGALSVRLLVTAVSRVKTVEPIEMPFGERADSRGSKEPCVRRGTYGRHLANMIERCVLGG